MKAEFRIEARADIDALRTLHAELCAALATRGRGRPVRVELAGEGRPAHLVLQLVASLAATRSARPVAFGPRAAAEIARMDGVRSEARA